MAQKKTKKRATKKTTKRVAKKPAVSKPIVSRPVATVKPVKTKRKITRPLAIVAFLLNVLIFVLPGIGSLIGGKTKQGIWQLVLAVIGDILSFMIIGLPILLVAWVWGIVTGIEILRESE